jgi:phosphatidylserine/phosphatidylglycerophosphate/cardiolipin synthase-like enzyme
MALLQGRDHRYAWHVTAAQWFLDGAGRGNSRTSLDRRHRDGRAWTEGNTVVPLVHGAVYYAELHRRVSEMRDGDLLLFVDWRGDPDERLLGAPASEIARLLCRAAERGVDVRGLLWRSHLDRLQFSATENRHLGADINAAGGECALDMRVRPGGSHHQKFVVLRHPGRPENDVAFVGGIDLCHSRRDDRDHHGDPQTQPMAKVYGPRPPWHDIQLMVSGPAVGDVETVFRERWDDPQPLTRDPLRLLGDRLRKDEPKRLRPLPPQLPDPEPVGGLPVQLLRTYPKRRPGYDFAPKGERSVARGYTKAIGRARRLIYLEDQYLWSRHVAQTFAKALRENDELRLIAVLPHHPDQDGRVSQPPNLIGRERAVDILRQAAGDRVAFYGVENHAGVPVYVHAKVCVIDDTWATVGSDNFNRRSWTHDSELSAAVRDEGYARGLRTTLANEHLDGADGQEVELSAMFDAFAESARRLQQWHDEGRVGERPAGRLRPLEEPPLSRWTRIWATPMYRTLYDPDGRSPLQRLTGRY